MNDDLDEIADQNNPQGNTRDPCKTGRISKGRFTRNKLPRLNNGFQTNTKPITLPVVKMREVEE